MLKQPVNTPHFWRKRLEMAKSRGVLHYSVYLANPALWKKVFRIHTEIVTEIIKPDERVLDAGCGYGRLSELLPNYVGIDISPDFIDLAKKRYPGKDFRVEDMKHLVFSDKEFDWAVCISIKAMIVNNVGEEEWGAMLRELQRVAKKVLILEYGDCSSPEEYEIL